VPYSDMAIHRIVRRAGAYWIETTLTSGAVLLHAESYSGKRAAMEHVRTLRAAPEVIPGAVLVDRRIGNRRVGDRRTQDPGGRNPNSGANAITETETRKFTITDETSEGLTMPSEVKKIRALEYIAHYLEGIESHLAKIVETLKTDLPGDEGTVIRALQDIAEGLKQEWVRTPTRKVRRLTTRPNAPRHRVLQLGHDLLS